MANGEVTITTLAKAIPVANAPIEGVTLTSLVCEVESVASVDYIVIKVRAIRPAELNDSTATEVVLGSILLLDPTTAASLITAIGEALITLPE